jgi:tetratricopeptide (TPR) repeat protein
MAQQAPTSSLGFMAEMSDPVADHKRRSNDECRAMATAYCHHRSRLRRVMEACDRDNAPIPTALRDALDAFVQDSFSGAADTSISRSIGRSDVSAHGVVQGMGVDTSQGSLTQTSPKRHGTDTHASEPSLVAAEYSSVRLAAHNISLERSTFTPDYKAGIRRAHAFKVAGNFREEVNELQILLENLRRDVVPDPETTGRVLSSLGDAHRATGDDAAAESVYFDWFLLMEKAGRESECVKALSRIGQVYHDRGDFDGARKWYLQAAERARKK